MQSDKPKTAIAEMLKQVKNSSSPHEGSEIQILKKNSEFKYYEEMTQKNGNSIIKIDTKDCTLWEFKDRPSTDLGDINSLADDIKLHGQTQPGIVRVLKNNRHDKKYEIIVGERRWRACEKANIAFSAIICNFNDQEAAIIQASENLQRKDLSDYAKGMNYAKLIDNSIITQVELQKKLNISKATMSALLSFIAIPSPIIKAIEDLSKVSANVASLIRAYANKGEQYIEAIINISSNIRSGIGGQQFKKLIDSALASNASQKIEKLTIKDNGGKELFTLKITNSKVCEIRLVKQIQNTNKFVKLLTECVAKDVEESSLVRRSEQVL